VSDIRVIHADCRAAIKELPDCSIDSVVTDPPYALVSITKRFGKPGSAPARSNGASGVYRRASAGFMGQRWDTGDTAFDPEFWAGVLRVLKPGGHLLSFGGTRTYHRMACAIEDAGFEIRDAVMWHYGSGFPKSHDVAKAIDRHLGVEIQPKEPGGGTVNAYGAGLNVQWGSRSPHRPFSEEAQQWAGWGTALKPATEIICLARKPLIGTVAANVLQHGTGALNIDGCRIEGEPWTRDNTNGKAAMYDGWGMKPNIKENASGGRWPANVIHDGSEEVLAAFPDCRSAGNYPSDSEGTGAGVTYMPTKRQGAIYEDSGSAARFFYSAKADSDDRLGSKHPTVKPVDLIAYLCRLITPPGGTVLDPFAGSGTTGMACMREGFNAVLIEREVEYVADIKRRIAHVSGLDAPLFGGTPDEQQGGAGGSTGSSQGTATPHRADRNDEVVSA
jgi:DNA modification methylase